MLAFIIEGELSVEHLFLVADKVSHDLTIDGIYNPDHVVFTTSHKDRCRGVPLDKVQIILRDVIECSLQGKAIHYVPDAQDVVHTTCDEPLAR